MNRLINPLILRRSSTTLINDNSVRSLVNRSRSCCCCCLTSGRQLSTFSSHSRRQPIASRLPSIINNTINNYKNNNFSDRRHYAKKSKGQPKRRSSGDGDPSRVVVTLRNVQKVFRDGTEIFTDVSMGTA
jgi:hypothetical protein